MNTQLQNRRKAPVGWLIRILALVLALIGLTLTGGGAWLAALGGSFYYLLAGSALMASGWLIWRGKAAGAWLYFATVAATLVWALWEVGTEPWALVPRLVGPVVLAALVWLALPRLTNGRITRGGGWLGALGALAALGIGLALAANAHRPQIDQPLPGARPLLAMQQPQTDWQSYGSAQAQRYSALSQINLDNVGQLTRAWTAHTGDLPDDTSNHKYAAENTPLVIGDTMYLCSAMSKVIALDAATGRERWRFDPEVAKENIPYSASCRGVAYAGPAQPTVAGAGAVCSSRIVAGTLDGRLLALDARTGRPCPGFGTNGEVDIKQGMGDVVPGMVSITSPPVIVRGVIVTGHQVLDGQKRAAPSGVIQAFDLETGELSWAWDMMRPDRTGRPPEGEEYTRGTPNMWTIATGDEALGLVYLPMGNSAVDYWSSARRPEENRYATALVALDAATGRPRWHFQTVHMDVWDYDLGSQPTLIDLNRDGEVVPALFLASKQGDLYMLDRRTGEPLHGVEERPVPQGGVEPEQRSATQPFSTYHTLAKRDLVEADMWGMSPIDQLACRIQFRRAAYDGIYTPPTSDRPWIQYPGYNGGADWGSLALDPVRGVLVSNYNDMPNYNRLLPRAEADKRGLKARTAESAREEEPGDAPEGDPQAGTPYAIDVNAGWRFGATGLLCTRPPYGGIRAIDVATGETIWDRPFGTARKNGPWGIPSMMPFLIGTPNNGGSVVTGGGLVFIAAATDDLFRAIDLRTGNTVWEDALPAGGQANPITYEVEGRQFVAIFAGGHHFMETPVGDEVVVYALPQSDR